MYRYICKKCSEEFDTKKKEQMYCSKRCANSINTSKRKIHDNSIFVNGITSESAYILGLILSDGCLSYDIHSHRYRITITMNEFELIESLRSSYAPTKKLYSYKHRLGKSISYSFISTNDFDVKFLMSIGIKERKSDNIRFPKIENKYVSHIIRGIFDGDGSVYINKTKTKYNSKIKYYQYINASFTTGSNEFANDIKDILVQNGIDAKIVKDSRKKHLCWYVKVYSKDSIEKLYNYLYSDSVLFLKRKRSLFNMMI